MQQASGFSPVEGVALSQIGQEWGHPTGITVLDDFLPWQGLPLSAITVLEGPQAGHLARKLVARLESPQRAIWIHSLRQRPFFVENESCFRLQVPEDADVLKVLPGILADAAFTTVIVQLVHPLSRAKAIELYELARKSEVSLILVCKHAKSLPWELSELVIETSEDFISVRKAQNRPVPLWIPVEMLEERGCRHDSHVFSSWNALDTIAG